MTETHKICAETHGPVPSQVWDTRERGPKEAFEFYREGICAAFMPLRPELDRANRRGFQANVRSFQLARGVLNVVSAPAHEVHRGKAEIAASPDACFYLNLQLAGECRITQGGKSVILCPGEVGIFDGATTFALDHRRGERLGVASLMVPKPVLRDTEEVLPDGMALKLSQDQYYGNLLCEATRTLATSVGRNTGEAAARLYEVVLSLATLAATSSGSETRPANRSDAQFFRVKRIIANRCADADFTVAHCAAEAGLAVGYVHNLFARHEDTFGACLLRKRLRAAAQSLRDRRFAHLPVSAIAYSAGFRDASHFGRVFRRAYDRSPAAWRRLQFNAH